MKIRFREILSHLKKIVGNRLTEEQKRIIKKILFFHRRMRFRFTKIIKKDEWLEDVPLISIISPFYNQGNVFEETVQSVLDQTFQDFEYIIVNDGSKPEERKKLDVIKDKRVKIIDQKNAGLGSPAPARNKGISLAKGKYICCLDSDDIIEPTFIEKALIVLETDPNVSLITSNYNIFGEEKFSYLNGEYNPYELFLKANMVITAAVFKKEAWVKTGGYKGVIGYEDWEFWINLAEHGFWGKLIPEFLFKYRRAQASRYKDDLKKHNNNLKKIEKLHPEYLNNLKKELRKTKFWDLRFDTKELFINLDRENQYLVEKKKKNILILIPWMTFGGAETLLYNFTSKLKDDFYISFITALESKNEWEYKFQEITKNIYHLPNLINYKDAQLEFVSNYIKTRNIDVLHMVHTSYYYEMLPELKRRFPKLKIICTLFNDRAHFEESLEYEKFIDIHTSDNNKVTEHLKKRLSKVDDKFLTFPNAVDCFDIYNQALFDRQVEREKLGIKENELAVYFIGRLSEEKGPDRFLEIAKKITAELKDVKFFIIGDGPMKSEIEKGIEKIKSNNIIYLGYQTEISKYLSTADIFVLCSDIEGFPLSILEAMAMKAAVISSDVGGVREAIIDQKNGFLIKHLSPDEFANKIIVLYKDRDLLERISKEGRISVETKFSTKILAKNYTNLYLKI